VVTALQGGQIQAEFRSISPGRARAARDGAEGQDRRPGSTWVCKVDLIFNTEAAPFDKLKVRQALSMAIDRWGGSSAVQDHHRQAGRRAAAARLIDRAHRRELAGLPGYGRDAEKARARPRSCWPRPGVSDLKFKLINRNVNHPFTPVGVYVIDQWRRIGVTAEHQQLESRSRNRPSPTARSRWRSMPSARTPTMPSRCS
jgi:peptide/nickel transport system substrate-binding protein